MTYRALGYWMEPRYSWSAEEARFVFQGYTDEWHAAPRQLVRTDGADSDSDVVAYLRGGREFESWRGRSFCRFQCGVDGSEMGSRCFTDGVWVWPEGLAHYVEHHLIELPEEIVATARARRGQVPDVVIDRTRPIDRTFWNEWYARRTGAV